MISKLKYIIGKNYALNLGTIEIKLKYRFIRTEVSGGTL